MKLANSPQWKIVGLGFAQVTTVTARGLTAAQLYPQMMFTSSVLALTELEINENRKITIKKTIFRNSLLDRYRMSLFCINFFL